jgi:hypothetical protein
MPRSNRKSKSTGISGVEALTSEDISRIRQELALDNVKRAEENLKLRDHFTHISDLTEVASIVFAGITSILSFAATGIEDNNSSRIVSWTAGICGVIGISFSTFSSYTAREADERVARLNVILKDAGIRPLPLNVPVKTEKDGEKRNDSLNNDQLVAAYTLTVPLSNDDSNENQGAADEAKEEIKDTEIL